MVEQVVQGDQEAEEQELMLRGVQEVQVVMVLVLPVVHFQEIMAALVVKHGATTQQVVDADSVVVMEEAEVEAVLDIFMDLVELEVTVLLMDKVVVVEEVEHLVIIMVLTKEAEVDSMIQGVMES